MHLMKNERKTRVIIIALSEIKKYEENSLYMKNQGCSILESIHNLYILSQALVTNFPFSRRTAKIHPHSLCT